MMPETKPCDQQEELALLCRRIQDLDLPELRQDLIAPEVRDISRKSFGEMLRRHLCHGNADCLVLDVRSESEYEKDAIPVALSMPILNDRERHEVGLLYRRHNHRTAMRYAFYLAKEKEALYVERVRALSQGRPLVLYCWRGGGRSRYAAGLLARHGFSVMRLEGGHKGFRRGVYQLLYHGDFTLWPLSGATGCGKSQVLELLAAHFPHVPVLHLEAAAGHAASVFGHIRFAEKGKSTVVDQQAFEMRLYLFLLAHRAEDGSFPVFVTEMESRKIGPVQVPPALFRALEKGPHIRLEASMEARVARLKREYFGADGGGVAAVRHALGFLTRRLGGNRVRQWQALLDQGEVDAFLKEILEEYYDRGYGEERSLPAKVLCSDDILTTTEVVAGLWEKAYGDQGDSAGGVWGDSPLSV
ncbi:tRNA 2-selenouridine synthase [Desulfobotulus alkaliphilus]|uniref:tRNA 2-selenouridine synthase n=1 Tax=Desulfobotulus alkaliphilus TaxID=622671 RepID=A0A562RPK6_9BACT|nr:tRNA 2-selenouridine(34) synthase MnmH [Desulfobotulus alkaliphilus]TWI70296.1 tRNA 2-selenouridine synthase [Desulfobotulus alkaliphilus]